MALQIVRKLQRRPVQKSIMAKTTENQFIDPVAEGIQVSNGDVKAVIERMVTVGYKELNEFGNPGVSIRKAQPFGAGL